MTKTPYANLRTVPPGVLRGYRSYDVSLEVPENPNSDDSDYEELEFCLFYHIQPAEPDVGIMSSYVDDYFYANFDGSIIDERLHDAIWDCAEKGSANYKWHERNLESAAEDDYYNDYDEDY